MNITKDQARRFIENMDLTFGKNHAFIIAIAGTEDEINVLKSRIIEWNEGYPRIIDNIGR